MLIRPESLELEPAEGGPGPEGGLVGEVLTHTFLGSTTRVKVIGAGVDLIADVSTLAHRLGAGRHERGRPRPDRGRAAAQPRGAAGRSVCRARSGRSVKIPVTPSAASSRIRSGVVHRVDGRLEAEPARRGEPARRRALVAEAGRPGAARAADRDAEADVLDRAEARPAPPHLLERGALEAHDDRVVVEERERARDRRRDAGSATGSSARPSARSGRAPARPPARASAGPRACAAGRG